MNTSMITTAAAVVMENTNNRPTANGATAVALLTAGHFLSDFYANFLPPLLPLLIGQLGLSLTTSGLLVMLYSITSNVLQPVCGYYIDKKGGGWLLLLTIPLSAVFICGLALFPSLTYLFLCVACSGLAASLFHPLGSSLMSKVTANQSSGLAMSIFIGGGNFGYALAPAVITACLLAFGTACLPWMIIPALLLTAAYYRSQLHQIPLARSQAQATAAPPWYRSGTVLKLNAVMALRSWAQVAIPTFLPILLTLQGYDPALAGRLLTVFLLGGAFGGLGGGYLGDRLGPKTAILCSLMTCLPVLSLFLWQQEITGWTWLLLAVSGATLQSTLPPSMVWAQRLLPGNAAMVSGMMLGLSFGLGGLGAAITGYMADSIGLHAALLWTLLPLLLAVLITFTIPYRQPAAPAAQRCS